MSTTSDSNRAASRRIALERSAGVQRLLAQFRPALGRPMPARELRAEALLAAALLGAAVPFALFTPQPGKGSLAVALLYLGLYAVTSRVEFDVGAGYGSPAPLVLVPMLFALPPGWVPLLVAAGFVAGKLPSFLSGARHPDRAVAAVANAWHALGPAIVFAVAGVVAPRWSQWPVLLAALAAQIAFDLAACVAREGLRLGELPRLTVRLLGPIYLTDVCLAPIGLAVAFAARGAQPAALITLPLSALLVYFARDRRDRIQGAIELNEAYRGTALLLGTVVEADDAYTGAHSRDVVELSLSVAPALGLDEDQRRRLELAALLHDVGKIAIPKSIINKPGPLTPQERALIETHTIEGQTMLERVGGLLGEVGQIVRSCHERYDGRGYPDGLAGERIPVEARIVACCDAFNAMRTDRSYRAALPLSQALEELRKNRGTQFDPDVVDALLAVTAEDLDDAAGAPREPAGQPA